MAELGGPGEAAIDTRSEAQRNGERARAHEVGKNLSGKKATEIRRRADGPSGTSADKLPPGEKVLYAEAVIRDGDGAGLSIKDINAVDTDDTLLVERARESDVSISEITSEETTADGSLTYICKTPGGKEERISADELIAAHAKKNADAIAETFDDLAQAAVVKWHAEGEDTDCPVPAAQIETMDVVDEPGGVEALFEINDLISDQIDALEQELKRVQADTEHPNPHQEEQLTMLLKDCRIATFQKGPGGILYKAGVLNQLQQLRTPQGVDGAATAQKIDELLGTMREGGTLDDAEDEFVDLLKEGIPSDQEESYQELAKRVLDGDSFAVLQDNPNLGELPGMNEFFFGDPNITRNIIDNLLGNADVDPKIKDQLKLFKVGGSVLGFSLIGILLALPATVLASLEGISAISKNMR